MWQILKRNLKNKDEDQVSTGERRRMDRIRMLLTINCQSSEQPDPIRIMTENINVTGIKFISSTQLFFGEILNMNILLHSHFPNITVKGRVVWCNRKSVYGKTCYEGGVEFLTLSNEDRIYLQKFIDKYRFDEFDPAV
jgi:c-di-GMP-binding flagellar brake protein YcgR